MTAWLVVFGIVVAALAALGFTAVLAELVHLLRGRR